MRVGPVDVSVIVSIFDEGVDEESFLQKKREVQGCGRARRIVILHQWADDASQTTDEGPLIRFESIALFARLCAPISVRLPEFEDGRDTLLREVPGTLILTILDERVERVHSLPQVVRSVVDEGSIESFTIQWDGKSSTEGEVCGLGVLSDRRFIKLDSDCIFGIQ